MNGNAQPWGGQHHFRMENMYLKQEVIGLEQRIGILEKHLVDQEKHIVAQEQDIYDLEHRTGWPYFKECALDLGVHQVDDAIKLLVERRDLYRREARLSARKDDAAQVDATGNPTDQQPSRASSYTNGLSRSTTSVNVTAVKRLVKKTSRKSLKRVESAFGLATRFATRFKNNLKYKGREVASDVIVEGDEEHEVRGFEESKNERDSRDASLMGGQRRSPVVLVPTAAIGTHPNATTWTLEKAQGEYKQMLDNEPAMFAAGRHSGRALQRRLSRTKKSREVEEELIEAMEKDLLSSFPRNKGLIRSMNWPEGSRSDEEIFTSTPKRSSAPAAEVLLTRTHPPRSMGRRLSIQEPKSEPRSAGSRFAQALSTAAQAPPASPAPAIPLPRVPHQSQPIQAHRRHNDPPPSLPIHDEDDVFVFERPYPLPRQKFPAPLPRRARRSRRRRSEPSPTPRFVSYRPASPSPGGNQKMPAVPTPSWLQDY